MTDLTEKTQEPNPLTKPKFIIAAVVLALIAILGIVLAVIPKDNGPAAEPVATAAQAQTHAAARPSADASICGLPTGDQSKPVMAPPDTKWELVGKMAAPVSPRQYGPGMTEASGLRHCFAHSPTGALYAAANVTVLSSTGNARMVYSDLAVPSRERDALLSQPESKQTSGTTAQIAGFTIRFYSSDRAVVDIAAKGDNGALVSVPVPLEWYGGDWKVILPATGSTGGGQISDLSGFVPWSGV